MEDFPIVKDSNLRRLTCEECGKDLDIRSHFIHVKKKSGWSYTGGMEIHVRCHNDDCHKSDHEKNKDYFTPIFVGAI